MSKKKPTAFSSALYNKAIEETHSLKERIRALESDMEQALHAIEVGDADAAKDILKFSLEPPR